MLSINPAQFRSEAKNLLLVCPSNFLKLFGQDRTYPLKQLCNLLDRGLLQILQHVPNSSDYLGYRIDGAAQLLLSHQHILPILHLCLQFALDTRNLRDLSLQLLLK